MQHVVSKSSPGLAQGVSDHELCVFEVDIFVSGNHKKIRIEQPLLQEFNKNCKKSRSSYNFCNNQQFLLFLAQIVVSCSENRAREGGCQGAPGHGHSSSFESGGTLFLKHFFGKRF